MKVAWHVVPGPIDKKSSVPLGYGVKPVQRFVWLQDDRMSQQTKSYRLYETGHFRHRSRQ
jgi:hypothetical protein